MEVMEFSKSHLYENADQFFELDGSIGMRLTPTAAAGVCRVAATRGYLVGRIEGGVWHDPQFEAKLDCIWDSPSDPPMSVEVATEINRLAESFIIAKSATHGAFIITTFSILKSIRAPC